VRVRSGSHLLLRGETWYYRRVVPADVREVFGCSAVVVSLRTSRRVEAERLEKARDVEFDERLRKARDDANPEIRRALMAAQIIASALKAKTWADYALSAVAPDDREAVREITDRHYAGLHGHQAEVRRLVYEIEQLLPRSPVDRDVWQKCRADIVSIIRHQIATATATKPDPSDLPAHTLEWAYGRWLRTGERTEQSVDDGRRHFNAFIAHSKLVLLAEVRRSHLVAWRDSLVDAGVLARKSINQRLQMVAAILRVGWRDAEMPEQGLRAITLSGADENERGSWSRDDILKALQNLEPHSGSAWIFVIGLTTGVRLGEPMAAERDWYDPAGFIHVTDRRMTKKRKLHCLPVIECLREPLAAYVRARPDGYLFDAPRPVNPRIKISHEASKWFGRFFDRHGIDRVFHELRDTWIEEAKHSPIEKQIYEIISGHSKETVSDRYGGQKPHVLAAANEEVCKFLTGDPEIKAAMLGLVA